ncbi:hypothetical protein PsorP6_014796 [Peronosclerospora sorghi]|uniref:Uncharacterized protein n=1 Tax=Peronosclerospora sorghi TaxID=230839 RepID=A0ACC0VRS5_9STRA|nr:hypothetical protein PsorP6_014796 [Peronosclerospora sorghi]
MMSMRATQLAVITGLVWVVLARAAANSTYDRANESPPFSNTRGTAPSGGPVNPNVRPGAAVTTRDDKEERGIVAGEFLREKIVEMLEGIASHPLVKPFMNCLLSHSLERCQMNVKRRPVHKDEVEALMEPVELEEYLQDMMTAKDIVTGLKNGNEEWSMPVRAILFSKWEQNKETGKSLRDVFMKIDASIKDDEVFERRILRAYDIYLGKKIQASEVTIRQPKGIKITEKKAEEHPGNVKTAEEKVGGHSGDVKTAEEKMTEYRHDVKTAKGIVNGFKNGKDVDSKRAELFSKWEKNKETEQSLRDELMKIDASIKDDEVFERRILRAYDIYLGKKIKVSEETSRQPGGITIAD